MSSPFFRTIPDNYDWNAVNSRRAALSDGPSRYPRNYNNIDYFRRRPTNNDGESGIQPVHIVTVDEPDTDWETPNANNGQIPLKIKKIDLQLLNNSNKHHTNEYDRVRNLKSAVFRRGESFNFDVKLNRRLETFNAAQFKIIMSLGPDPIPGRGTYVMLNCGGANQRENSWWAKAVREPDQKTISFCVNISPYAPIGRWTMQCVTRDPISRNRVDCSCDDIYVIFNPWCKHDQVYLGDDDLRDEYILNETGKIWQGNWNSFSSRTWNFGQFDDLILEASMKVLEDSYLKPSQYSDSALVCRGVSATINTCNYLKGLTGVLAGNWSKDEADYADGINPSSWTGSTEILKQFLRTGQPVLYGQCWVFSGVLTTVCRSLGIPCRSITNFLSAHDSNGSLTLDTYYDEDGNEYKSESSWNYHCWNDVWMKRPDLPAGNDGWQAVDATPQEESAGYHQCGPAPLSAIKRGDVGLNHDLLFVFAEVNADNVKWFRNYWNESDTQLISVDNDEFGWNISTKVPRRYLARANWRIEEREDITAQYKHKEYRSGEREIFRRALLNGGHQHTHSQYEEHQKSSTNVGVKLNAPYQVILGSDCLVEAKFTNSYNGPMNVDFTVLVILETYKGDKIGQVKQKRCDIRLKPNQTGDYSINIDSSDYLPHILPKCSMKVVIVGHVVETKRRIAAKRLITLKRPEMELKLIKGFYPQVGQIFKIDIKFDNPITTALRNCRLSLEGAGVVDYCEYNLKDVECHKGFHYIVPVTPKKAGARALIAKFWSDQLWDIDGALDLNIVN